MFLRHKGLLLLSIIALILTTSCVANKDFMLRKAVSENDLPLLNDLINEGANVNTNNSQEFAPLLIATNKNHVEVVKRLIEAGADLDADTAGVTALIMASGNGNLEIVKLLVEAGSDVNIRSHIGDIPGDNEKIQIYISALSEAKREGHDDIVDFLIKHGAKDYGD